jgi:midasin (ATPase involved in ribosome maturation)
VLGIEGRLQNGEALKHEEGYSLHRYSIIIIYLIASNFKKDKIWLRRSLPTKRTYKVVVALDNSLSMSENNVG